MHFILKILTLVFFAAPALSMTCNLLEVERDNEIHGLSYAEKFKTVLVGISGTLEDNRYQIQRLPFLHDVMDQCYKLSGEWRCGSVPKSQKSSMFPDAYLVCHASAKFYKYDNKTFISYSSAWVDNLSGAANKATILNDVYYFRGAYDCK